MDRLPERITSKIEHDDNGCWTWVGARNWDGYGMIRHEGATRLAHRIVYTLLVGPIADGLTIDHLCRNRACVNPDHLESVTRRVNVLRGDTFQARHAAQTRCKRGHEFTPENTYIEPSGSRRCIACRRARVRAAKRAKAATAV